MEYNPDWNEESVVNLSVDETHENGDLMMLEELYQQEEELIFLESIQQFAETELSKFCNETNTTTTRAKWDPNVILETSNDSTLSQDETFSSTFAQESMNNESTFQLVEDPFMNSEDEDISIVSPLLFVDCGTIDYEDNLDYGQLDESQMDSILTEYFEKDNSSLDVICIEEDDDVVIIENSKDEHQLRDARVCLERLSQSTVESIIKAKVVSNDVTVQNNIKLNDKKGVQLYYLKCKKFSSSNIKVSLPKNCHTCGDSLLYLCTKCKQKYFITYTGMSLHRKNCKSKEDSIAVPTSITLYACQDCDFKTLHDKSMTRHLRKTGHRSDGIEGVDRVEAKEVKYIKEYEKDVSKAFKRFCKNCNRTVSSNSSIDDRLCGKCKTRLLYRCLKCNTKSKSHKSLMYHLKAKCLSKKYICCQCDYVTIKQNLIKRHINQQHSTEKIVCEHCDFVTTRKSILVKHLSVKHKIGESFHCRVCNKYTTNSASLLDKHMLRCHTERNDENKEFQCAICRRYKTNNQDDLWKHIERRHCEK